MAPIPRATAHIRTMYAGATRKQLMSFDDNVNRVVLFPGNPQGTKVLAVEFVVTCLAKKLGVPVAEGGVVNVPESIAAGVVELSGLGSGLCFGCRHYKQSYDLIDMNVDKLLSLEPDVAVLAGIVVLDTLTLNVDRRRNLANLLIAHDKCQRRIVAIDHGQCFGGRGWLRRWEKVKRRFFNKKQAIYHKAFTPYLSLDKFDPFLRLLYNISRDDLGRIMEAIPVQWWVSDKLKRKWIQLLLRRKELPKKAIQKEFYSLHGSEAR